MEAKLILSVVDTATFQLFIVMAQTLFGRVILSALMALGFSIALVKPFFQFGIGACFGRPTGGNLATPSAPVRFGTIQDVNVDFTGKNVPLRGQNQFPDDVAPGDKECKGKAAFGKIDVNVYNSLFFGDTVTTGVDIVVDAESHAIAVSVVTAWAAGHSYATLGALITDGTNIQKVIVAGTSETPGPPSWNATVGGYTADGTVVWLNCGPVAAGVPVTNVGTWVLDLGVVDLNTGQEFIPVTTSPNAGEYQVTAGTYVFNAGDLGKTVGISYVYTSAAGENLVVINHILGYGPTFELWLSQPYMGTNSLRLFKCRASKMSAPMKRDNYLISDFEFEAYDDGTGKVFAWYQTSA